MLRKIEYVKTHIEIRSCFTIAKTNILTPKFIHGVKDTFKGVSHTDYLPLLKKGHSED